MAARKPYLANTVPLGLITVTTKGTPVQITSNYTDLAGEKFHEIRFTCLSTNTGNVYITHNNVAADTAAYGNIVLIIPSGAERSFPFTVSELGLNRFQADIYFADADTSGNKVVVTAIGY